MLLLSLLHDVMVIIIRHIIESHITFVVMKKRQKSGIASLCKLG